MGRVEMVEGLYTWFLFGVDLRDLGGLLADAFEETP